MALQAIKAAPSPWTEAGRLSRRYRQGKREEKQRVHRLEQNAKEASILMWRRVARYRVGNASDAWIIACLTIHSCFGGAAVLWKVSGNLVRSSAKSYVRQKARNDRSS